MEAYTCQPLQFHNNRRATSTCTYRKTILLTFDFKTCLCTPCTFCSVDQNGVFHVGTDGKVRTICRKCKEKLEGSKEWICVDNPKCEQKDCGKYASYREKGHKRRFCAEHHTEGMISANKKCDLCEQLVNFGAPGGPQTRCAEHKKEGMIGPAARVRKPPPPKPVIPVKLGDPAAAYAGAGVTATEFSTPSALPSRPLGECPVPTPWWELKLYERRR